MAENSAAPSERCRGGCHCSCYVGKNVLEDKGNMVEDVQSRDSGEVMLAENCYNAENTATDCRILAHLERELQAAF